MKCYKYVFIGQSAVNKEDELEGVDYAQALFNYNILLKNNPAFYFKVEGKSLCDRLHEEVQEFRNKLTKYFADLHKKEEKVGGEEKIYFERVGKINEKDFVLHEPKNIDYSSNQHLLEFIKLTKLLENKNIIDVQRTEFDRIFQEILMTLSIRYIING